MCMTMQNYNLIKRIKYNASNTIFVLSLSYCILAFGTFNRIQTACSRRSVISSIFARQLGMPGEPTETPALENRRKFLRFMHAYKKPFDDSFAQATTLLKSAVDATDAARILDTIDCPIVKMAFRFLWREQGLLPINLDGFPLASVLLFDDSTITIDLETLWMEGFIRDAQLLVNLTCSHYSENTNLILYGSSHTTSPLIIVSEILTNLTLDNTPRIQTFSIRWAFSRRTRIGGIYAPQLSAMHRINCDIEPISGYLPKITQRVSSDRKDAVIRVDTFIAPRVQSEPQLHATTP